jgi:phosphoribosyl 1,2-cyclic phosphate phosphodiesterase
MHSDTDPIQHIFQLMKQIGAEKTYFTHITHDVVHEEANAKFPKGIELAYDGLTLEV